jgi:trimethylamine--corrinoid protein Co-methyltransferase
MKTDFHYPQIADRRTPAEWEDSGQRSIRDVALQQTRELLATHFPKHIDTTMDEVLRAKFDISLPCEAMAVSN